MNMANLNLILNVKYYGNIVHKKFRSQLFDYI